MVDLRRRLIDWWRSPLLWGPLPINLMLRNMWVENLLWSHLLWRHLLWRHLLRNLLLKNLSLKNLSLRNPLLRNSLLRDLLLMDRLLCSIIVIGIILLAVDSIIQTVLSGNRLNRWFARARPVNIIASQDTVSTISRHRPIMGGRRQRYVLLNSRAHTRHAIRRDRRQALAIHSLFALEVVKVAILWKAGESGETVICSQKAAGAGDALLIRVRGSQSAIELMLRVCCVVFSQERVEVIALVP
jgi:hypothetical protein